MRVVVERTFLTTAEGRQSIPQISSRQSVDAPSLRSALIQIVTEEDGRILGSVTESDRRAVCTGWACGRVFLLVAEAMDD